MASPYEQLAETLGLTGFKVRYEVSSTVELTATEEDLEMFFAETPGADLMSYSTLRNSFLAWCIQDDGYDYSERGRPRVIYVIEDNAA